MGTMKPFGQKQNNLASGCRAIRAALEDSERNFKLGSETAAHFEQCRSCRLYSEQLTMLRNLLASQPRVQAPPDFDIKLRRRLIEAQNGKPAFWQFIMQPAAAMATAAAIVGIAATLTFTVYVQKPGHLGQTQSPISASSEYRSEASESAVSSSAASSDSSMRLKTETAEIESVAAREAAAVRESAERAVEASSRLASRGVREIKEIRYARELGKPRASDDDVIVIIHDRSNRSHTVPIKMVTYGSQPVVNLGALVSPGEIEESLSSDDESRIF